MTSEKMSAHQRLNLSGLIFLIFDWYSLLARPSSQWWFLNGEGFRPLEQGLGAVDGETSAGLAASTAFARLGGEPVPTSPDGALKE